jgi:hypothetical protein
MDSRVRGNDIQHTGDYFEIERISVPSQILFNPLKSYKSELRFNPANFVRFTADF